MSETMDVRPIAGALGAEITGLDLSQTPSEATLAGLRRAWLDHKVIFFRDQRLSPDQFLVFAKRFGRPARYPFVEGLKNHPEIIAVTKERHETVNFGGLWHSDTVYLECPPMGTLLYALEVPRVGGDTLFADQELAYESLSSGMQALLDPLVAINRSDKAAVSRTRVERIRDRPAARAPKSFEAHHPVVRTHPETGRKALYVNGAHSVAFEGMSAAESRPILDYLFQHQVRPEFTCRFRWAVGSLAFWDNRSCQHNPVNDYHGQRREMHRITLEGGRPA